MNKPMLFHHTKHPHQPTNVNHLHDAERLGWNDKIAVTISKNIGTMVCAYIFAVIGVASLAGALTGNAFLAATFGALSSYFLQLVLLPVIMVGQNVQARHAELQASEAFLTAEHTFHDTESIKRHLEAQDQALIAQDQTLVALDHYVRAIFDHLHLLATEHTNHELPIVRLPDTDRLYISLGDLRALVARRTGMRAETVAKLPTAKLLALHEELL